MDNYLRMLILCVVVGMLFHGCLEVNDIERIRAEKCECE